MDRFLDGVFNGKDSALRDYPDLKISLKTRVGYNDTAEFENAAKIISRYPFSEITVHPRLKKDMYGGRPRMEMFDEACRKLKCDIAYNGDITSVHDHDDLIKHIAQAPTDNNIYGNVKAIMIGRGAITDPGIFRHIKTGRIMTTDELYDFLSDLFETYKEDVGAGNALAKLKEVWSYTTGLLEDDKEHARVFKTIVKSKDEATYKDAVAAARKSFRLSSALSSK